MKRKGRPIYAARTRSNPVDQGGLYTIGFMYRILPITRYARIWGVDPRSDGRCASRDWYAYDQIHLATPEEKAIFQRFMRMEIQEGVPLMAPPSQEST